MVNPLDYVSTPVAEDCRFKISPSSFGYFVTTPWVWYRQHVLGLDKFEYSTSSVIGTIVHYVAECVATGVEVEKKYIEKYIEKHEENDNYCKETVRDNWYTMSSELVNGYVLTNKNSFFKAEMQVSTAIRKGIYCAGTLDLLEGTKEDCTLVDYKTYNSKTKPKTIVPLYKYQLLAYAYLLRKLGYKVNRIKLVFVNRYIDGGISEKTGKPLKSYNSEVTEIVQFVDDGDMEFIEGMFELAADKLEATEKYPELSSVIWHDPRLKP